MPLRFICTDDHAELAKLRIAHTAAANLARDTTSEILAAVTEAKAEAAAVRKEGAALRAQLDRAVKLLEGMAAAAAVPLPPPPSLAPDENASPTVKPARTPRGKTAAAKDGTA